VNALDRVLAEEAHQAVSAEPLDALSDQELARRARRERQAFGALYERHVAAIYRYVFYRVGNIEDAEDLTARVFARALRHIHNYNDRGVPFTAWLYRIAHNAVANFHRDNSRRPSVPLDEADALSSASSDDDHEQRVDRQRQQARLLRAVRMLPPERQHLLVLKFVEQLQNAEIGQIMNRSEGAVKSLYHRTLLQLRQIMEDLD
jgi:RNA polymerase sigma-70 factor (ECF subfamily)